MDVPGRNDKERALARAVSKLNAKHKKQVLRLLGNPPKIEKLTPEVWSKMSAELRQALSPIMIEIAVDQAAVLMEGLGIGVDWALVNEGAVEWARRYSFELVTGITNTTKRAIQKAVSAYYELGLTIGDLESRLASIYGPVRAEMIAVTEVTRAAMEGEKAVVSELHGIARELGFNLVARWHTNNDDLVCDICEPRNGKLQGDGWDVQEPAHPRCRCWITHTLVEIE